jgi:chemosensory pili system protein ChpA (sensor histidine kinase/response regulator)
VTRDDDDPVAEDGLGEDETRILRSFFCDEAHESLESATRLLLAAGAGPLAAATIDELLRTTHTLKGSAATVGLGVVADLAHELEDCFARLRDRELAWSSPTAERLVEAIDACRALVDAIDTPGKMAERAERCRALIAAAGVSGTAASPAPKPGPMGATTPAAPPPKTLPDVTLTTGERRRDDPHVLRVDPVRVDRLMHSVGELVFDRTRIERRAQELRSLVHDLAKSRQALREQLYAAASSVPMPAAPAGAAAVEEDLAQLGARLARATSALLDDADALRRTTQSLQDGLSQVRMLSVRVLFQRLARPAREMARHAGKRIALLTSGESTEFDKTVADQITDPLLQILRNAIAHGIEPENERIGRGKSAIGQIRIAARTEGESVLLEVADDGAGIDVAELRRRFVADGRWTRDVAATASDGTVLRAIFEPGVSTRDEADDLAGRGVGLDAVRETLARLGGDIHVQSTRGQGTTFTLRLPLTTAISQALLFKIDGNVYGIPNVHVSETTTIEASSPIMPPSLRYRDESVPLVILHSVLGAPVPSDSRRVAVVVIEYAGRRFAVTCDRVIGPREIVVQSLGTLLAPLPLYAGGTISGSGKVQLILDSAALVRLAYPQLPPVPAMAGAAAIAGEPIAPAGRVLLADDSRSVREALSRMLTGAGYVVDTAEHGRRALEMLRQMRYDALISDIEMPQLGGFELIEQLRADHALAAIPVIVISSRTARANRSRAVELGARTFLPKPVTRKKLLRALDEIIG